MMKPPMRLVGVCLIGVVLGCGGTTYPDLVRSRDEVKALKRDQKRLSKRLKLFQRLKYNQNKTKQIRLSGKAVKSLSLIHI